VPYRRIAASLSLAFAVLVGACLLPARARAVIITGPRDPAAGERSPTHFEVAVSHLAPQRWPNTEEGVSATARLSFGLGPGLEAFAEWQNGMLSVRVPYSAYVPDSGYAYHFETRYRSDEWKYFSLGTGARGILFARGPVRPYLEAGVFARFSLRDEDGYWLFDPGYYSEDGTAERHDGFGGALRFGFTTAQWRSHGVWLDGGWEFIARNPTERSLIPIRLGVRF
jgi:hypothetical protein